jgi:release factor glutamine methyltransferase
LLFRDLLKQKKGIFSTFGHMSDTIRNISEALTFIRNQIDGIYPPREARSIAYLLIEETLSISKTELLANNDRGISKILADKIKYIVSELKREKPIQYLLGSCTFLDCRIHVGPGILIPRPETEELVQWIIKDFQRKKVAILDVGTGSGCIAIALSRAMPGATIYAIDSSPVCVSTAKKSARLNNQEIRFIRHNLFSSSVHEELSDFDIIVSNPPYVLESEKASMGKNVTDNEPHDALFVKDDDPLLYYREILSMVKQGLLKRNGYVYFEINEKMGKEIFSLLESCSFSNIELKKDLSGKDRMVKAEYNAP